MSDRPIQIGDLVQVVKWPCCGAALGAIFKVNRIDPWRNGWVCAKCRIRLPEEPLASSGWSQDDWGGPLSWLKRIPHLEELEGKRTEETLKVPE